MSGKINFDVDHVIASLIAQDQPFALYRLPNETEPCLIMQDNMNLVECQSYDELGECSGFLMAPFALSKDAPMVVLKADKYICGFSAITDFFQELSLSPAFSACSSDTSAKNCAEEVIFEGSNESLWQEQQQCYQDDFATFHEALNEHRFDKLVLATRRAFIYQPFKAFVSFMKACKLYPKMMVSLVHSAKTGTWLGATPEILLKGQGKSYQTMSLAGTMLSSDEACQNPNDLSGWSDKDRLEQEYVTTYIEDVIKPYALDIKEQGPYIAMAGPVCHLRTDFEFTIKDDAVIGSLIGKLHPTPAVCGLPKEEAYQFIVESESINRRYYSGMLGPINLEGQSQIFVNLRCMEVKFPKPSESNQKVLALAYAGGGNLRQSQCHLELQEACNKMRAICSAIADPTKGE